MKVTNNGWHFTRLLNEPLEDEDLSTTQKMVFVALSYFMDKDGNGAHPSYQTIGKIAGCTKRTAVSAIAVLIEKGYIQKRSRWDAGGNQTSNDYVINTNATPGRQKRGVKPGNINTTESSVDPGETITPPGETDSPPPVKEKHPPGETVSPKLEPLNENQLNEINSAAEKRPPSEMDHNPNPRKPKRQVRAQERSPDETKLYHAIEQSFLSQNDDQFPSWGKEGRHIWGLVDRARKRAPDNPEEFISQMLDVFWRLKKSRDRFWSGQPFLASALNASGIWDRVLESWRETRQKRELNISAEEFEKLAGMF